MQERNRFVRWLFAWVGCKSVGIEHDGPAHHGAGPADFAFVAVVPVTLVLGLLGAYVAPRLFGVSNTGRSGLHFFKGITVAPEPLEQVRYFLVLMSVPAVVLASVLLARLLKRHPPPERRLLAASVLVEALAVVAVLVWWREQRRSYEYVSGAILVVAAVAAVATVAALLWLRPVPPRWTAWSWSRLAGVVAVVVAVLVTLTALLPSLFHERNISASLPVVWYHLSFTLDEFAAVANGRTALVDFVPQYSNVLPYLMSPVLSVFGFGIGSFTVAMLLLSLTALLTVFLVFARVCGRWVTALVLYLPFLALSLYPVMSEGNQRVFVANYFAVMPLRYFGPWVVAGLLVWQARRPSRRRQVCLFVVAGAVMLNNPDFGVPSFCAAVGSAWLMAGRDSMRSAVWARRVLSAVAAGLALAAGAIVLLSLVRSGRVPDFGLAIYFARQFAVSGFYMLPMTSTGLHLVIGLTFAGALVRAVFRSTAAAHQGDRARLLTGSLAYGSVFGFGASSYYVGRSHPEVLVALFSAWAFVLALLAWDAFVDLRRSGTPSTRTRALWAVPSVLVSAHLFLAVAPAWELRAIGEQVNRIAASGMTPIHEDGQMVGYVRRHANPGETVMILVPLSHRIALRAGVRDAFPYNSIGSVVTQEQLRLVRRAMRAEQVRKVFTRLPQAAEVTELLVREGYRPGEVGHDPSKPVLWSRP